MGNPKDDCITSDVSHHKETPTLPRPSKKKVFTASRHRMNPDSASAHSQMASPRMMKNNVVAFIVPIVPMTSAHRAGHFHPDSCRVRITHSNSHGNPTQGRRIPERRAK
jgi:hypothetical protein